MRYLIAILISVSGMHCHAANVQATILVQILPAIGITSELGLMPHYSQNITIDSEQLLWINGRSKLNKCDRTTCIVFDRTSKSPSAGPQAFLIDMP
jgi:hypothetical protein